MIPIEVFILYLFAPVISFFFYIIVRTVRHFWNVFH